MNRIAQKPPRDNPNIGDHFGKKMYFGINRIRDFASPVHYTEKLRLPESAGGGPGYCLEYQSSTRLSSWAGGGTTVMRFLKMSIGSNPGEL
jgi:hypothetical protein